MNDKWKILVFTKNEFEGFVYRKNNKLKVTGKIKDQFKNKIKEINYIAADPVDDNYSFSGSGLPFHSFQHTSNKINIGNTKVKNNEFNFSIKIPNSFYKNLGSVYVGPRIYLKSCNSNKYEIIDLGIKIPSRFLNHPAINYYPSKVSTLYLPVLIFMIQNYHKAKNKY